MRDVLAFLAFVIVMCCLINPAFVGKWAWKVQTAYHAAAFSEGR